MKKKTKELILRVLVWLFLIVLIASFILPLIVRLF